MNFSDRSALEAHQLERLRALVETVLAHNVFYRTKLGEAGVNAPPASLEEFSRSTPFTWKRDFVEDQRLHPPYGTNLGRPLGDYVRLHQTSGTTSKPLRWLDTPEGWSWMVGGWQRIFAAAGLAPNDRVLFPFAFGPFIGFWLAFEAATRTGSMVIPAGGVRTEGRLRLIAENDVTVVCSTPTYAIRMGEAATELGIDLSQSKVRVLMAAGEPGASVPATRALLEKLWPTARIVDHHGMTEVGPVSYPCPRRPGVLHVMESSYYAEVLDPETLELVAPGEDGELVLTPLGRFDSPAIRYRTRDIVRPCAAERCACGSVDLALEGGIIGRVDDMVVIRGVNIYPSAVEDMLRADGGVAEYRVEIQTVRGLPELRLLVEPAASESDSRALEERIIDAAHRSFGIRFTVECAEPGSLPRFEAKAKRWVRV